MWRSIPLLVLASTLIAQPTPPINNWIFDEITLANGAKFQGLLVDDGPDDVRFQTVKRSPGQPTFTLSWRVPRSEVGSIKKLTDAERTLLKERIAELDLDGSGERKRIQSLDLAPAMWLGEPAKGKTYRSECFELVSDAAEEVIRRAAVRLEQIYAAYARFLPPVAEGRPTTIQLAPDRDSFKLLLAPLGHTDLLNPAVYDPRNNLIVCGSDLRKLGKDLEDAKFHHAQQIADLDRYEASIRKLYKDAELRRYLDPVRRDRGLGLQCRPQERREVRRRRGTSLRRAVSRSLPRLCGHIRVQAALASSSEGRPRDRRATALVERRARAAL